MSYIAALIAATRGHLQGVQPRLDARFEHAAPYPGLASEPPDPGSRPAIQPAAVPVTNHRPAPAEPPSASPLTPLPPAALQPPPVPAPSDPPNFPPRKAAAPPWDAAGRTIPPAASPTIPAIASPVPKDSGPEPVEPEVRGRGEQEAPPLGSEPPWPTAAPLPAIRSAPTVTPAATPAGRRQPAEAPTIRVTIGRIDVRADPAPAPARSPPRPATQARPGGDSALVRYLKQQGRP